MDCVADVHRATLNGVDLDLATVADGRIPLPDLAAENELVVSSSQPDTGRGAAIKRTVDPSDKLVYVWSSFEPDGARRAWACFDQPDLKAPHRFEVSAPDGVDGHQQLRPGLGRRPRRRRGGGWLWRFPDTPPLSTYVVVVNGGPFHEIREQRGDHSLGLYCRQSLRRYLERDADELFRVTEQGLAFFGERFAMPFPQERYDQVFVPDMGGAMENWGCVTWTDSVLFRSPPTFGQRQMVATVLLHEMAHMWFGDLVTMRWWDDLWLNEAFASWAATWAAAAATEYDDGWATYLAGQELRGYEMDMGPASHPIRGLGPRRRARDGELRRDHLRQGPGGAGPAGRLRRRGHLRRGAPRLLPRPRLGQHRADRPDGRRRRPPPDATSRRGRPRGWTGPAPTP